MHKLAHILPAQERYHSHIDDESGQEVVHVHDHLKRQNKIQNSNAHRFLSFVASLIPEQQDTDEALNQTFKLDIHIPVFSIENNAPSLPSLNTNNYSLHFSIPSKGYLDKIFSPPWEVLS